MNTYIILLRGVNVSGKNKLPMKDLKNALTTKGYVDVQTYIQSGNLVLKTEESEEKVQRKVKELIAINFDIDTPVLVRTKEEWTNVIGKNPYNKVEEKQQYFTFLSEIPTKKLESIENHKDTFEIIEDVVYINAVGGYGKTKWNTNFFEKKLEVNATTRNLKTLLKLEELATNW